MRIAQFCREHKIGLKTINALLAFLNIEKTFDLNTKVGEEDVRFLISQLEIYNEYVDFLAKAMRKKNSNKKNLFNNIINRIHQEQTVSNYEKYIFINTVIENYSNIIIKDSRLSILKTKQDFNEVDFDLVLEFFQNQKKEKLEYNDQEEDGYKETKNDYNTNNYDDEDSIMYVLKMGLGDRIGF